MSEEKEDLDLCKDITLELGDVIEIHAHTNPDINNESFFITYLDGEKIDIVNISTFLPHTLKLDADGNFTDESIQSIILLSRSEQRGYARQHLLLPKTWIDIHFGGDVRTIIAGEITNLEEDMIEVTTYPDMDVIYIDFAYKGIPQNIPLDKIVIRTKPASLEKIESLVNIRDIVTEGGDDEEEPIAIGDVLEMETRTSSSIEYTDMGESIIKHPEHVKRDPLVREQLHALYLNANKIVYGEELEEVVQRVEIPEHLKRYGVDTQVNDMLDELLSEIPNTRRTKTVLNNIQLLIQRFRELRSTFSKFDANGNLTDVQMHGYYYKPLVERLQKLDVSLKWIIPVTKSRRKLYTSLESQSDDIIQENLAGVLTKDDVDQQDYFKGRQQIGIDNPYEAYYKKIHDSMTPYDAPMEPDQYLIPNQTIGENIETIANGLEEFYSTVYKTGGNVEGYVRRRFVIDRYNLGLTRIASKLLQNGKRVYIREPMTKSDQMTIDSFMILPKPVLHYARAILPNTNILDKTMLSQTPPYLFKLLQEKTDVMSRVVTENDKQTDFIIHDKVCEYVAGERLEEDSKRHEKFLDILVPATGNIIDAMVQENSYKLNLKDVVDIFEPFMIYLDDITYQQYNKIRYHIKNHRKEFIVRMDARGREMAFWRNGTFPFSITHINEIENILTEKRELLDILTDIYKLSKEKRDAPNYSSSETLSMILSSDNGQLFVLLIQWMMVSLVTPENLAAALDKDTTDDMMAIEKIKANDCTRRVLTKRYTSIRDLQTDNGEDDVAYDKEFDDTPYDLLKKYEGDRAKMSAEKFLDFLAVALITKHDSPVTVAKDIASDMIAKQKRVREGEYAILELTPHLPADVDEDKISAKEKRDIQAEANLRKKTLYFKRVKNVWVHDDSISETAFIDNNTLFCNLEKACVREKKAVTGCEPVKDAQTRMREIAHKKMLEEFDERVVESLEHLRETIQQRVETQIHQLSKQNRLRTILTTKFNDIAYEIGQFKRGEPTTPESPYAGLRDKILGQQDFVKRQSDIIRFVETYCSDLVSTEADATYYHLYCRETNVQLLPRFLHELANAFVMGENYPRKVAEICRKQGVISDDGDSWVDRYTGYVICKIDFVNEDMYDDAGFKVITGEIMEKDIIEELEAAMARREGIKDRIFDNEEAQLIHNIYSAICANIGISDDTVEDFVQRICKDLFVNIMKQGQYDAENKAKEAKTGKAQISYQTYYNQSVIFIVVAVLLVAIQTTTPSLKIRKTFPGCVRSFQGYPENDDLANIAGIKYLACVVYIMKKGSKSIMPWREIAGMPQDIIQERIKRVIQLMIVSRSDIMDLYLKKREYLEEHPEEIPEEYSLQKWTGFMPPLVEYTIVKELKGLASGYKDELLESIRIGSHKQREHISTFRMKCAAFGYGIIECISNVVKSKDMLLKTASNIPFLENACCNEKKTPRVLDYFIGKNEEINRYLKMVETWETVLNTVRELARAPMIYHAPRTGIISGGVNSTEISEHNIYAAFIYYCNLDRDVPIPEDLRGLIAEKMPEYNVKWTILEKIEFFKSGGKRFSLNNLQQLMEIINRKNIVKIDRSTQKKADNAVSALRDFLKYLDTTTNPVILEDMRERLDAVLEKYNPRVMVHEESKEMDALNNYLIRENDKMLATITKFLEKHGHLTRLQTAKISKMLSEIHIWSTESPDTDKDSILMFTITQFMKTSVFAMSRTYPEVMRNGHLANTNIAAHWGLSDNHKRDLANILKKYYESIEKFKDDAVIMQLLTFIQTHLTDLNLFLEHIPLCAPMHKYMTETQKEESFYCLFDPATIYRIYLYVWYYVLYQYIEVTDDDDLLHTDMVENKTERRTDNREITDPLAAGFSSAVYGNSDVEAERVDELREIQIIAGDKRELKERVAELLIMFLEMGEKGKLAINYSYKDIERRVIKSRQDEKKMITDFLGNMGKDERKVENLLKMMKLGRWSVGLQKGLVDYDKDTYDREQQELLLEQLGKGDVEMPEDQIDMTVDDLAQDIEKQADEEGEHEAYDFRHLDEEYMDGDYYGDDDPDDYAD